MPRIRSTLRRFRNRVRIIGEFESHAYWRRQPIRTDTVVYESFSGNGFLCNPEAMLRALLAAPDMGHLKHIVVLDKQRSYAETKALFRDHANVTFVTYKSAAYYRALATSKYLFNNATFPPQFAKRPGQVYVNTWHGTPLKKMGYDIEGGGPDTRNVIRNFVNADYLLSGSEFMTKQMYESAYKLTGLYRGKILEEGFPRVDRQQVSDDEAAELRRSLRAQGVRIDDGQKIILYAPTWKGNSFYTPEDDMAELRDRVAELNSRIDTTKWRVLLKVHQQVYKFAAERPEMRELLVPNDMPTNVVLGISDVLISDYSSIFFDFLATGRPILFYVPDLAKYSDNRGLYLSSDEWPGPVTDSLEELAGYLNRVGSGDDTDPQVEYAARYDKCAAQYVSRQDGHACERVIDVVFRGRTEGYNIHDDFRDGRESILMYLGGMRTNGITSSLLNLLDNIDHTRFDVSVFYSYRRRSADRKKNEAALNPNVRLFPYIGGFNGSKRYTFSRRAILKKGLDQPRVNVEKHMDLFRNEWQRVFGDCQFDYVIDFSGYGPFWTYLLLAGKAKTRSIWMHNDMAADRMREVNGKRPFEDGLGAVFSAYKRYDRLVSVCEPLLEVNKAKLGAISGSAEYRSALNTLNFERILEKSTEDLLATVSTEGAQAGSDEGVSGWAEPEGPEPLDPDALAERQEAERKEAERRALLERIMAPPEGVTTFITIGRLSPEKNHARLLRAFSKVHAENPATRLLVVGGGALRDDLDTLITELGLDDAVIMTGQQDNPYALLAIADCFVFASDYEGQGIVILEARVLGLPVVSTDFDVVRGALPEGTGLVVPRTEEGLTEGMLEYLRGNVPSPTFDYKAYNREAIQQFYEAIGAERDDSERDPEDQLIP
jgi:CDP-glycerol glycerophosphotransferase (TagB/SpsB family)/glycosyltransferase involved in cell wall biosynthesis